MLIQLIFSLLAISFLFWLNKKLGGYETSEFTDEASAIAAIKVDIPDNKTQKLGSLIYLNNSTALFEFINNSNNEVDSFCLSQAMGDIFVSRVLPLGLLIEAANNLKAENNTFTLTINPNELTLPKTSITFNDTDPLYYWIAEQKSAKANTNKSEVANAIT